MSKLYTIIFHLSNICSKNNLKLKEVVFTHLPIIYPKIAIVLRLKFSIFKLNPTQAKENNIL